MELQYGIWFEEELRCVCGLNVKVLGGSPTRGLIRSKQVLGILCVGP